MGAAPYLAAVFVFLCGLGGVIWSRNLVHLVNSLGVAQASTWMMLVAVGWVRDGTAPIADGSSSRPRVDAVVQAMTLTDIIVGAVVTALLLALAIQAEKHFHTLDPEKIHEARG